MVNNVNKTVSIVGFAVIIACIIGFTTKPDEKSTGACRARCFANPQEAVNYINSQGYSGNRARLVQGGPGGWIVVTDN
jgi:hypothetical protein